MLSCLRPRFLRIDNFLLLSTQFLRSLSEGKVVNKFGSKELFVLRNKHNRGFLAKDNLDPTLAGSSNLDPLLLTDQVVLGVFRTSVVLV